MHQMLVTKQQIFVSILLSFYLLSFYSQLIAIFTVHTRLEQKLLLFFFCFGGRSYFLIFLILATVLEIYVDGKKLYLKKWATLLMPSVSNMGAGLYLSREIRKGDSWVNELKMGVL